MSAEQREKLGQAEAIIRLLMDELNATHFGSIHTLSPEHPTRAAYDRAAGFLSKP